MIFTDSQRKVSMLIDVFPHILMNYSLTVSNKLQAVLCYWILSIVNYGPSNIEIASLSHFIKSNFSVSVHLSSFDTIETKYKDIEKWKTSSF